MILVRPLFSDQFFHNGRGPVLERVHWAHHGAVLAAIDYFNPDTRGPIDLRHVRYGTLGDHAVVHHPAGLFDLGRTPWLESFSPQYLTACRHFRLKFHDELFDVICMAVTCQTGGFRPRRTRRATGRLD